MLDEAIYQAEKALAKLLKRAITLDITEQETIAKALQALTSYPAPGITGLIEITVSTRYAEGGSGYASIEIGEEGLELSSGGSAYDPEVGSDSFSRTDFAHRLESDETEGDDFLGEWQSVWYANLPGGHTDNGVVDIHISDNSELLETGEDEEVTEEKEEPEEEEESTLDEFAGYTARLPRLLAVLQTCVPATRDELAGRIPRDTPGIYVFYHQGRPVYVGRTRDLRRRLGEHGRDSSSHYSASFAFLRARRAAETEGHELDGFSRKELAGEHPVFRDLFVAEKRTVAAMTVRWVVIGDPVMQALLEVYTALELCTPFNSFETS